MSHIKRVLATADVHHSGRLLAGLYRHIRLAALLLAVASSIAWSQESASVFINELHYDNQGQDEGEAIELAGPADTDLSGWRLVLYNGSDQRVYAEHPLSGRIPDQQDGFGTLSFRIANIQKGALGNSYTSKMTPK